MAFLQAQNLMLGTSHMTKKEKNNSWPLTFDVESKRLKPYFFLSTHLHPFQDTCLEPCTCLKAKISILRTISSSKIHAWSFVMAKWKKKGSWHYFKFQARCLELRMWPIGKKIAFDLPWAPSVEFWTWCMAEKRNCYWPLTFNIESRRPKTKKISFNHAWNFHALQWAWMRVKIFF